ncbi:MAG: hypothetical protein ACPGU1_02585 [Myxococcota bacterium]
MRITPSNVFIFGLISLSLLLGGGVAYAGFVDGDPVVSDPGKGAKRALALALTVGAKGHVAMIHTASLTGGPGGDVNDKTMKTGLTWTILSGDAERGWRFQLVVDTASTTSASGGTASRTLLGRIMRDGAMTLEDPQAATPDGGFVMMMVSEFAQNAVRLPRQPVGEGAIWETVRHSRVGGIKSVHTARYTLKRLTPGGFEATVKSLVGTGGGGTRAKGESSSVLHWKASGLYPQSLVTDAKTTTYAKPGVQRENVVMTIRTELRAMKSR